MSATAVSPIRAIAVVTSMASTLASFRGPMIQALVDSGVRVYALAPDYDVATRTAVAALGATVVDISLDRTGIRPARDLADLVRLARRLRGLSVDATFCYFAKPVIYGTLAAWLARVQHRYAMVAGLGYAFTPGERETFRRSILRGIVTALYRAAFGAARAVFFQNLDDLRYFVARGALTSTKAFRVNGSGVDLERFEPAPAVLEPMTFLLMARLLREKGIREYAEAARRIKHRYPNTRFLLLGAVDSNPGSLSEHEVQAWVRDGVLEWPGQVLDVRPWIAQASVYVLPSYREGVPRSTLEAMAMARPVITTDAVGCRETVEDGRNGFLVPVRDAGALSNAMLRFIENPTLVEKMGNQSRQLAEERFDARAVSAVLLRTMGVWRS